MLLGTRPEEQDVGPKATDIMSGVFEVFVNLTQVFAGDPKNGVKPSPAITCHHPNRHPKQADKQSITSKGDGLTVFFGKNYREGKNRDVCKAA